MTERQNNAGRVYLVGAGPGDPGLITVRGAELLSRADAVLYDYLVNPRILLHLPAAAERICLGRHGHGRLMTQEEVHRRMIALARAGKMVVRLKGGDPAVFAHLADEAAALHAAGIPFEVVPGITAALAAGSYAGVPLTHRDIASAVALVTGREQENDGPSKMDYGALATFPGTLVFYMGVTTAPQWTRALIDQGRSADTPATIVRRCSWTDQKTFTCTLGTVVDCIEREQVRPPALVIVGEVCRATQTLNWFTERPLFGQNVLVTRPVAQADALCSRLGELGAGCVVQPAIAILPPSDWSHVDAILRRIGDFDWLVFSSANGVRALLGRLVEAHGDVRSLGPIRLAAIGPHTADALEEYHLRSDLAPAEYRAEALADALAANAPGQRFLLARASRGREVLAERLTASGGQVEQVVVYQSRDVEQPDPEVQSALADGKIDWITVTSSAIARSLVALFGDALRQSRLASISPITSETLRSCGYEPAVEATEYTTEGLVDAMVRAT